MRQAHHSILGSVFLHLFPAIPVFVFYLLIGPAFIRNGLPAELGLLAGFVLVGIPIELGYLLYLGKQRNGGPSLRGIVLFRRPMPVWQYVVFFLLLLSFAFFALFLTAPLTGFLAENVFAWMPSFLLPDGSSAYPAPSRTAILITLILRLIFDGVVNPVVEELYFRGYLLPRIAHLGWIAPLMSAFLFSLQHYWQPYNLPLIFLIQIAIVYVVWWKKNIYISILAHCGGNLIGAALSLIAFLSLP